MHKNQTIFFFPQILEIDKKIPTISLLLYFLISHFDKISPLKNIVAIALKS
jgi:hypothetical protein